MILSKSILGESVESQLGGKIIFKVYVTRRRGLHLKDIKNNNTLNKDIVIAAAGCKWLATWVVPAWEIVVAENKSIRPFQRK